MKNVRILFVLIIGTLLIALSGCKTLDTKPTAQQLKEHATAVELLKAKLFLIKADRLSIQNRAIPSAMPSTNFVTVSGDNALVQISPGTSGGPNGVGGFTVRGTVTGYKFTPNDDGSVLVQYHVSAIVGACDVSITLDAQTANATVFINNTYRNLKATINGAVIPVDDSFSKGYTPF